MAGSVIPKRYARLTEKIDAYLSKTMQSAHYRNIVGLAAETVYGSGSPKAVKYAKGSNASNKSAEKNLKVGDMLLRELRREVDIKKSKITFASVNKIVQQYAIAVHNDARDDLVANRYMKLAEFLFERKSSFEDGPQAAAEIAKRYQSFAQVVRGNIETGEAKKK